MSYHKDNPESIQSLFNSIAKNYDRTNAILSLQMHKRWNNALIEKVLMPSKPKTYLDLCSGTGAIALEYLTRMSASSKTYLLDFSEEMLAHAKKRAIDLKLDHHEINYLQADAQKIPLMSNSISVATIAYGIRNVSQPAMCIKDVYRVLEPGGTFGILELTQPENPLLKFGHGVYLKTMLPLFGKLLTSNKDAYRYLCNSIHTFIPPSDLESLLKQENFKNIRRISFLGGVATLLISQK